MYKFLPFQISLDIPWISFHIPGFEKIPEHMKRYSRYLFIGMDICSVGSSMVECFVPLERLWPSNNLPDSIVVQNVSVNNNIHQFAVLDTALIRDSLMAGGAERLAEASNQERAVACESNGGWQMVRFITPSWRPRWQLLAGSQPRRTVQSATI